MKQATNSSNAISKRKVALIAGISFFLIALAAGFSYGFVHGSLVIVDDAAATLKNLQESTPLFRAGILGWLLIFLLEVILSWALYTFFRDVNRPLALLMAWLRLAYNVMLSAAMVQLVFVLSLLGGETDGEQVLMHIASFEAMWALGLIAFGFHLLLLGYLLLKSRYAHAIFWILLTLAALGYLFVHTAKFMMPDFENQLATMEMVLAIPMTIGELGFAVWLLMRGGKEH